jgi:hypothetical protein
MKISEFNKLEEQIKQEKQKLDELSLSTFIGDLGSGMVKSAFSGKGLKQQMIQDMFLKDFYDDAITSLDNAVKGKLVNKDIKGTLTGTQEVDPSEVGPNQDASAAQTAPAGTTAGAVAANKAQQQTSQNINNYVKQAAQEINKTTDKNQKIALTKELVNAMADRQGTPEWNNTVKGVEGIIKRAGVDPGFANTAITNLRAGKTLSEAWRIYFANKLVESVGLTWKDLGLCVLQEGSNYYIAESRYVKLNQLFESIVEATDGGQQSVGQYMLAWFNQYMTGVDWKASEATVLPLIQAIEDSYPSGYKSAVKTLARTAFAISKASPSLPAGIKDETDKLEVPDEEKPKSGSFWDGVFKKPEADASSKDAKKPTTESRRRR